MARKSKASKLKETVFAEILEQAIGKETEEAIVNGATYLNTSTQHFSFQRANYNLVLSS